VGRFVIAPIRLRILAVTDKDTFFRTLEHFRIVFVKYEYEGLQAYFPQVGQVWLDLVVCFKWGYANECFVGTQILR
jgi:hypothetical protein